MTTDTHTNTLRGIDRLNAGRTTKPATVDQPRELEWAYPARPETVGRIRGTVTRAAHEWGAPIDTCTRIRLVINELAMNALAVSNPEASIRVRLRVWPLTIRIGVWDANPDKPKTKDGELSLEEIDALPEDHDFGAWSLLLVRELASGHHVEKTEPDGKYIWVDFDVPDGHILKPS
jgi:anti-sigma regulatory factor (Ser/Thr protein kinase)